MSDTRFAASPDDSPRMAAVKAAARKAESDADLASDALDRLQGEVDAADCDLQNAQSALKRATADYTRIAEVEAECECGRTVVFRDADRSYCVPCWNAYRDAQREARP